MMNKQLKSILFLPLPLGEGGRGVRLFFLMLLLFASCAEVDSLVERDVSTVSFSLPSGDLSPEPAVSRADGVNMEVGTTVRVLAYRRPVGASAPVLSAANYAGEVTYKVALGSALELCGVKTDANGTPSVDAGATPVPLQLIQGTYDFYAVTPALEVDHTGTNPTLSVRHRTDYAVSVTAAKSISPGNNTVGLTTLERRCTLLSFGIDRMTGVTSITSAIIDETQLTAMATEPMTAIGASLLDVAANTNNATLTMAAGEFSRPDAVNQPYRSEGHVISLPKSEAVFGMKMKVRFNGATESTLLEATGLPAMAFAEGLQYKFSVRFKERGAELVLTILPWTALDSSTDMGESPLLEVVIGEWTELVFDTTMGGATPFLVSVEGWKTLLTRIDIGEILPVPGGPSDWNPDDTDSGIGDSVGTTEGVSGWDDQNSAGNVGDDAKTDADIPGWTGNNSSTELGK